MYKLSSVDRMLPSRDNAMLRRSELQPLCAFFVEIEFGIVFLLRSFSDNPLLEMQNECEMIASLSVIKGERESRHALK